MLLWQMHLKWSYTFKGCPFLLARKQQSLFQDVPKKCNCNSQQLPLRGYCWAQKTQIVIFAPNSKFAMEVYCWFTSELMKQGTWWNTTISPKSVLHARGTQYKKCTKPQNHNNSQQVGTLYWSYHKGTVPRSLLGSHLHGANLLSCCRCCRVALACSLFGVLRSP